MITGVLLLRGLATAADGCREARAKADEYLRLVAGLSENGFTDEAQLKRQSELLLTPPRGLNLGYYIYTSSAIESCSVQSNDRPRLVLRFEVAGHVSLDPKSQDKLPTFRVENSVKQVVLRLNKGRLEGLDTGDPFYPPIVAIQDYKERSGRAHGAEQIAIRLVLEQLDKDQKAYLSGNKQQ